MYWNKTNRKKFGEAVQGVRKTQRISQNNLAQILQNKYKIKMSQSTISSIEHGERIKHLPLNVLDALKDCLSLSEDIYSLAIPSNSDDDWLHIMGHNYLITEAIAPQIANYLGNYYCVFRSTETSKDKLIHCQMELLKAHDGSCDVVLKLPIKERNKTKEYRGKFFINTYFDTCYIILCGKKFQEISMMIAPLFKGTTLQNKFITPLVLTTSAGTHKRPTAHRMLISRKELQGEMLELAKSQLMLNTDSIRITKSQLEALCNAIDSRLKEDPKSKHYLLARKFCKIIEDEGQCETVFYLEEARLQDLQSNCSDEKTRSKATALIRLYSENVFHNKIGTTGPKIFSTFIGTDDE